MAKKKKKMVKRKSYKITELVISDENESLAIDAISLVSDPAIEIDFVYMNKSKNNLTMAKVDEEKRMLISPALIPDKAIYRYNAEEDQDFYVYFSKSTVRRASELYLKNNNHHKATHEHSERVSGVLTIESWIKEDMKFDKSNAYGFDLPLGTWFVTMKVTNDDMWSKIKEGTIRGLSIEGYFVDRMEAMGLKAKKNDDKVLDALAEILKIK
tara:strand:- start:781 stop:1416 length:636 start_codon:yes stop_codon:yes gene_type:complete